MDQYLYLIIHPIITYSLITHPHTNPVICVILFTVSHIRITFNFFNKKYKFQSKRTVLILNTNLLDSKLWICRNVVCYVPCFILFLILYNVKGIQLGGLLQESRHEQGCGNRNVGHHKNVGYFLKDCKDFSDGLHLSLRKEIKWQKLLAWATGQKLALCNI